MLLCVSYISITEIGQSFTIMEPCEWPYRHIELQIMNRRLTAKKLPFRVDFQSISCGVSSDETDQIQPSSSFTLESYYRCPHRQSCSHTLVEGGAFAQDGTTPQMILCVYSESLNRSRIPREINLSLSEMPTNWLKLDQVDGGLSCWDGNNRTAGL
jgi:hypothetical protein